MDLDGPAGSATVIPGASRNRNFGEEILGGLDYDGNGHADLFVGDLTGDGSALQNRFFSGIGHVLFGASETKGLSFDIDAPPLGFATTKILGADRQDIAADTAAHADFDLDGFADLVISAPHGNPQGRNDAGIVYVLHGQSGGWPAVIDLLPANFPAPSALRITQIDGAHALSGSDSGDTLTYSGAAGDFDGDGRPDLLINEMLGNGLGAGTEDVGNLLIVNGRVLGGPGVPALDLVAFSVLALLVGISGAWWAAVRHSRPLSKSGCH